MTKTIYGWHIVHTETGIGYAFCQSFQGTDKELTEAEVLDDLDSDKFHLVPLIVASEFH